MFGETFEKLRLEVAAIFGWDSVTDESAIKRITAITLEENGTFRVQLAEDNWLQDLGIENPFTPE